MPVSVALSLAGDSPYWDKIGQDSEIWHTCQVSSEDAWICAYLTGSPVDNHYITLGCTWPTAPSLIE